MTKFEKAEYDFLFETYRKSLDKELEECWKAFKMVNNITAENPPELDDEEEEELSLPTQEELDEYERILRKARGIKKTSIYKSIEYKED